MKYMKLKFIDWLIILTSLLLCVLPFYFNSTTQSKLFSFTIAIAVLGSIVENKVIRRIIAIGCFLVLLVISFYWYR